MHRPVIMCQKLNKKQKAQKHKNNKNTGKLRKQ